MSFLKECIKIIIFLTWLRRPWHSAKTGLGISPTDPGGLWLEEVVQGHNSRGFGQSLPRKAQGFGIWALEEGGISIPQFWEDHYWNESIASRYKQLKGCREHKMKKKPKLLWDNQNIHIFIKLRKMIVVKSLSFKVSGNFVLIETFILKRDSCNALSWVQPLSLL